LAELMPRKAVPRNHRIFASFILPVKLRGDRGPAAMGAGPHPTDTPPNRV
jgi:hypothetical protein